MGDDITVRYRTPEEAGREDFPRRYTFKNVEEVVALDLRSKPAYALIGQCEEERNERLGDDVIDIHPEDRQHLSQPLPRAGNGRTIAEFQLTVVAGQDGSPTQISHSAIEEE